MSITPFKPIGVGGTVNAINVFRITFSQALSAVPVLTAWDAYTASTVTNTIFVGTGTFIRPMIAAVGGAVPGSSDWFPGSAVSGDTTVGTPNVLKGGTNRAQLASSAPGVGGTVVFNVAYKIPYDVTTLATMDHIVTCEYQYTGTTPTVTFEANKTPGTEGSPNWVSIDSLAAGIAPSSGNVTQLRPCNTGTGYDGDALYKMTIPQSGNANPEEIWVKDF